MSGTIRALKYAAFRAGRIIGITLLMSVAFVFYFMFLDGEHFTVQIVVSRIPSMIVFVGSLMCTIYGMIDVATYTQYTISCGTIRRDVLISTIFMHVLQIVALEIVLLLIFLVPKGFEMPGRNELCLLELVLFLAESGLALVMGILIHRFGKSAYIVFVIFCAVVSSVCGFLVGFGGGNSFVFEQLSTMAYFPLIIAAGLVWYVVMAAIFWLFIRRMEVRV